MSNEVREPQVTPAEPQATTSLWRHADFNKLWVGESISVVGSELTTLGLPLTAIIMLKAGPAQIGVLSASTSISILALAMFAGVLVDRFRRRPVMIISDVGQALLIGLIPLLAFTHTLNMPVLYVVALGAGAFGMLFQIARYAYMSTLLEDHQLVAGNGRMQATESVGTVAGSSLAGALLSIFRPAYVMLGDAISYLVSAACLINIRRPEPAPARSPQPTGSGRLRTMGKEISEGVRLTYGNRYSGPLTFNSAGANFGSMMILSLFILYANKALHLSPFWIGLIYAAGGLGGAAGGALANATVKRIGFGRATIVGMLAFRALCLVPFVRGAPTWVLVSAFAAIWFTTVFGVVLSNVCQRSLQQYVLPGHMLGRIVAASRTLGMGVLPLAALLSGFLGGRFGIHFAISVGAAVLPLPILWVMFSPIPRLRDITEAEKVADDTAAGQPAAGADAQDGEPGGAPAAAPDPAGGRAQAPGDETTTEIRT